MDDETRAEIDDAGRKGIEAEALSQALISAITALLYAGEHFDDWRAWCDAKGWHSGPDSAETLHASGMLLAAMEEGVFSG